MTNHFRRGQLLYAQSRHAQAIAEFKQHLVQYPDDAVSHGFLALCLSAERDYAAATEHAETAVHLAPDSGFSHYVLASVLDDRRRLKEAQSAIEEAIRLDPDDSDNFALAASIQFQQSRWAEARKLAEEGLALDPEDVACANLRAMSLTKLGQRAAAGSVIETALMRDPENSFTHANQGWTLLDQGQPVKAMEHFREALRLNPELKWAREGIVEAMKARNIVYRLLLGYFLWMAKLSPRAQWGIVITGFFGYQLVGGLAASNPKVATVATPILIAYLVFVWSTWIASPLFNLLLRIDKIGRLALSPDQTAGANCVGGMLLLTLCALGSWLWYQNGFASFAVIYFACLIIPVSAIHRCEQGWPRRAMTLFTIALASLVPAGLLTAFAPEFGLLLSPSLGVSLVRLFVFGVIASPWVANALIATRLKY